MPNPKRNQTIAGRTYEVGEKKLPSVTTILSVIGKPALISWAASVEREMVLEASAALYIDAPEHPKLKRETWLATLLDRLGKDRASKKLMEKAGDIGSQVHHYIEWIMRSTLGQETGPEPVLLPAAKTAFLAWDEWRSEVKLTPVAIEQTVWSNEYGYAGTMDLAALIDGPLTATDYFTGESKTIECNQALAVMDWKSGKRIYPEAFLQNAAYRHAYREMGHGDPKLGLIVRLPKTDKDPSFEAMWCPPEEEAMENFLHAKKLWEWQQKHDKWLQEAIKKAEAVCQP